MIVKEVLYTFRIGETRQNKNWFTQLWFTEFAAYGEENKANLSLPLDLLKAKGSC